MEPITIQTLTSSYTLERLVTTVPLAEYIPQCVDVPKFLEFCKVCPNYGKRWSCPPFTFDPMEVWRKYDALCLVSLVITPAPGTDADTALELLRKEKASLLEDLLALETRLPGSLALSAGTCELCRFCTRAEGEACRRPSRLRWSIEALGGDVTATTERYLGRTIQWSKAGETPDYLTLVGGLLLPASSVPKGGRHG